MMDGYGQIDKRSLRFNLFMATTNTETTRQAKKPHWSYTLKMERDKMATALESYKNDIQEIMCSRFDKLADGSAGRELDSYELGYQAAIQEIHLRLEEAGSRNNEILNS